MTEAAPRPVRLEDVARLAGVSKGSASKALADRYDISPATKARVLQAAQELKFVPNFLARGLGTGKTQTIGFVSNGLDARFVPEIVTGAEDALGADRWSVFLSNTRGHPDWESRRINDLLQRSVDGLIVSAQEFESRRPIEMRLPVPVVYVYGFAIGEDEVSVVPDNTEGGRMATQHLLDLGRRSLACIMGPRGEMASEERADGFARTLVKQPLQPVGGEVMFGEWTPNWGWEAAAALLDAGSQFDGLVCGSDQIARGAIELLVTRGLRVPEDVAVIGYDNWLVISESSRHPFSTVDMNLEQIGRVAAELVTSTKPPTPGIRRVLPTVVVRESTKL